MKTLFEFGDIVENHWTDGRNPQFRGVVISETKSVIRLRHGDGKFSNTIKENNKLKKVGQIFSPLFKKWLKLYLANCPLHSDTMFMAEIVRVGGHEMLHETMAKMPEWKARAFREMSSEASDE